MWKKQLLQLAKVLTESGVEGKMRWKNVEDEKQKPQPLKDWEVQPIQDLSRNPYGMDDIWRQSFMMYCSRILPLLKGK